MKDSLLFVTNCILSSDPLSVQAIALSSSQFFRITAFATETDTNMLLKNKDFKRVSFEFISEVSNDV